MKNLMCALALVALWTGTAAAQSVSLSINDGRVTLEARDATIRQILAEWQRLGGVKVVGAERLSGTQPLTITLTDVPERQALDIVLRSVPGYMAVDRATPAATLSRYDRLVLLPRTTTPVSAAASPAPAAAQAYTQPAAQPEAIPAEEPDQTDVEQFTDAAAEPPMPAAPVMNPYDTANGGPYGGSSAAAAASGTVSVNPPETQFDYANPQRYFERMRQLQSQQMQQQQAQPGQQPTAGTGVYPGSMPPAGVSATPGPTAVPTAPGTTLAQPGIAPVPQPQPGQPAGQTGQPFNPYNLPPDWVPPPVTPQQGTPVEPDRSKYANPYVPQTRQPND